MIGNLEEVAGVAHAGFVMINTEVNSNRAVAAESNHEAVLRNLNVPMSNQDANIASHPDQVDAVQQEDADGQRMEVDKIVMDGLNLNGSEAVQEDHDAQKASSGTLRQMGGRNRKYQGTKTPR